jgi:hypothetical protein
LNLAATFKKRVDIEALSALNLCGYILSSQVFGANAKLYECRKFIAKNRCKNNLLCLLPGQFTAVNNESFSFTGRFDNVYLSKQFPKTRLSNFLVSGANLVQSNIKNPQLARLVGKFPSWTRIKNDIGERQYEGECVLNPRGKADHYAQLANNIFTKYGLGAEGAGRFFQLFWEEYMSFVRDYWVDPEFQKEEYYLGFECFGYGNNLKEFGTRAKKTDYLLKIDLETRLNTLLPEISRSDLGDVTKISKKIRLTKSWDLFGTRGAYLALALNPGVNMRSLVVFRKFFVLATSLFMEHIPKASMTNKLVGVKGRSRFQRTAVYSKHGYTAPSIEEGFEKNKYVVFIRKHEELMTTSVAEPSGTVPSHSGPAEPCGSVPSDSGPAEPRGYVRSDCGPSTGEPSRKRRRPRGLLSHLYD